MKSVNNNWCKRYFLNDLVEDERDLWFKLVQSLALLCDEWAILESCRFKGGLRLRGEMLDLNTLFGGFICINSHKLAGRLFVMVLKSNVSIFRLMSYVV